MNTSFAYSYVLGERPNKQIMPKYKQFYINENI